MKRLIPVALLTALLAGCALRDPLIISPKRNHV
ncbi:lipoprotein [Escherichia coli]|nr:lipoprotein [Escherichia coli]